MLSQRRRKSKTLQGLKGCLNLCSLFSSFPAVEEAKRNLRQKWKLKLVQKLTCYSHFTFLHVGLITKMCLL